MKYMITKYLSIGVEYINITLTSDEIDYTSFPAIASNPNYDAFLVQVDLTDEEVHALPVDEWFEV